MNIFVFEFLPHFLQKVAAISVVFRKKDKLRVWPLDEKTADEANIVTHSFSGVEKYPPTLVTWNATGDVFDFKNPPCTPLCKGGNHARNFLVLIFQCPLLRFSCKHVNGKAAQFIIADTKISLSNDQTRGFPPLQRGVQGGFLLENSWKY